MKKIALWGAAGAAALLLALEVGLRLGGVLDVPLFRIDPHAGYIERPSQSGAFMRKHRWAYNDHQLGSEAPFRPTGVLLVGDSVVNGGNPLDHSEKLGPMLEKTLGVPVWPLAAGGWALENQLQALKSDPALLKVPTLVVVSNSGDFGAMNSWSSPLNYPLQTPPSAIVYVAQKKVFRPRDTVDSPPSAEATARWRADVADLLARYHGRVIWVLYPKKEEIGAANPTFSELRKLIEGRAEIIDVSARPDWSSSNYRDDIHPSIEGNRVLSEILAQAILRRATTLRAGAAGSID